VVARVVQRARQIKLGSPLDLATEMGPIAFREQLDKVRYYVDLAVTEGAELACGGGSPADDELRNGFFHEATVLTNVSNDMRVAREEIFGPVLSVIPFDTEDEAVRIANDTEFGLAAGVWTQNLQRAHRISQQLKAGTIWVNAYRTLAYNVPYGGFNRSGLGRENGLEGLGEFLETKSVWIELSGLTRDPFKLG